MSLPGPSRTITVEPIEAPFAEPAPEPPALPEPLEAPEPSPEPVRAEPTPA